MEICIQPPPSPPLPSLSVTIVITEIVCFNTIKITSKNILWASSRGKICSQCQVSYYYNNYYDKQCHTHANAFPINVILTYPFIIIIISMSIRKTIKVNNNDYIDFLYNDFKLLI